MSKKNKDDKNRWRNRTVAFRVSPEEAAEYGEFFEEESALYVSVPVKGGASMLVADDGTVLYANSSVSLDVHLREFRNGRRTPTEAFR